MALAPNKPTNVRLIKDGYLVSTKALPVAANTVNLNGIDLVQATPYPTTEKIVVNVSTAAATGTANSKNINVVLQDSADNTTFTNIAELANPVLRVTDDGGSATAAGSANVLLPPAVKRYIRASATGEANGGDASGSNITLSVLF